MGTKLSPSRKPPLDYSLPLPAPLIFPLSFTRPNTQSCSLCCSRLPQAVSPSDFLLVRPSDLILARDSESEGLGRSAVTHQLCDSEQTEALLWALGPSLCSTMSAFRECQGALKLRFKDVKKVCCPGWCGSVDRASSHAHRRVAGSILRQDTYNVCNLI